MAGICRQECNIWQAFAGWQCRQVRSAGALAVEAPVNYGCHCSEMTDARIKLQEFYCGNVGYDISLNRRLIEARNKQPA